MPSIRQPGSCGTRSRQFSRAARSMRRRDDLEVFRPIGIGADDEPVFPMLDVIFDCGSRRGAIKRGGAVRRRRIDQIGFRRLMVMRVDDEEAVGLRLADAGKEAGILLFIDERVGAGGGAELHGGRP